MYQRFMDNIPAFLKKWDHHLLLNHPRIWATRIHIVGILGLIGLGLATVSGLLTSVELTDTPDPEMRALVLLLVVAVAVGAWAWWASAHSNTGGYSPEDKLSTRLATQSIFFGGVMLLALIPLVYGTILTEKIRTSIEPAELMADIDHLNLGEGFFSYNQHERSRLIEESLPDYVINLHPLDTRNWEEWRDEYRKTLKESSLAEKKEFIADYLETLRKYSGNWNSSYTPEKVLKIFRSGQPLRWADLEEDKWQARENVERIKRAQGGYMAFQDTAYLSIWMMFVWMFGLAMLVFMSVKSRDFIIAGLLGIASLVILGISISAIVYLVQRVLGVRLEELAVVMIPLGYACAVGIAFNKVVGKSIPWIGSVSLILLTLVMPPLLFLEGNMLDQMHILNFPTNWTEDISFILALLGSVLFAGVIWNAFFWPRISQYWNAPKRK